MNDKPTMIEVTDPTELKELGRLTLGREETGLDVPYLVVDQNGKCFCLADEYRAWKRAHWRCTNMGHKRYLMFDCAECSPSTSQGEQHGK